MAKELTHRADELKDLGWNQDDVHRYIELWDYRQRWGAINLERDDRQFLRKAESLLPSIVKGKASVKKPLNEKSYYRWLIFYLEEMNKAEDKFECEDGSKGLWSIIIEEELRLLEYYQPVLGLPDTLKAKLLAPLREELVSFASNEYEKNIQACNFDFLTPLKVLQSKEKNNWKPIRDGLDNKDSSYPMIKKNSIENFRMEVRKKLLPTIIENFPSLSETDKPAPPEDWSHKSRS